MTKLVTMDCKSSYRLSSMKRAGHHAIIRWLMGNFNPADIVVHKNGVEETLDDHNPYILPINTRFNNNGNQVRRLRGKFLADSYIYNYEEKSPKRILNIESYSKNDSELCDIVVIRDPYNMIASRLECNFIDNQEANLPKTVALWLEYADVYLNHKQENLICINFNAWFRDKTYRQTICAQMGLSFLDRSRAEVARAGGGSSFDGLTYDGKAHQMDVLNRYKHYMTNALYKKYVLTNPDIKELSHRIFGEIINA